MEATPVKALFTKILGEFLDPIVPDPVALGVLRATGDENLRAQELAPLIRTDPAYRQYLFAQTFLSERVSEWLLENEGRPNRDEILLERILGLLGKAPVRNLIACARIERLSGAAAALGPDDKVSTTPSKAIPFALEAETSCQDNAWRSPEAAFMAGLHYDWLAVLIKNRNGSPDEKSALTASFKEGLLVAKVAYELGQRIGEIGLGDLLFASALLLPIGKALMACLYPKGGSSVSWADFNKVCDGAGDLGIELAQLTEPKRFAVTHAELTSLFVNFGACLRETEKALYFYPMPERLKHVDHELYQLSALLSVAVRVAKAKDKRPHLDPPHEAWLKQNNLDATQLKAAMAAALKAK